MINKFQSIFPRTYELVIKLENGFFPNKLLFQSIFPRTYELVKNNFNSMG